MTIRPSPLETFIHILGEVDLTCKIEYEQGERQTWDAPGCPESATLVSAHTEHGTDVTSMLTEDQVAEIECAFLEQEEEV